MKQGFLGVQALRGLGALMVVVFHTTFMMHYRLDENFSILGPGAAGVDLFFAISGFIMVVATRDMWGKADTAWPFFARRLMRIVPLYWIMTTVKFLQLHISHPEMLTNWNTVASYLFIPAWNFEHRIFPMLLQGWTLSFEMLFYGLIALCFFFKKAPVWPLSILFAVLGIIGCLVLPSSYAVVSLLDQRLIEFGFGMLIARAMLAEHIMPKTLATLLIPLCLVAVFATGLWASAYDYRLLLWGIPMALLLAAVVAREDAALWRLPLVQLLGDASYAIYLTHDYAISVVRVALQKLHLSGLLAYVFGISTAIIISCIVGIIVHKFIEKPITRWLHQRFHLRHSKITKPAGL